MPAYTPEPSPTPTATLEMTPTPEPTQTEEVINTDTPEPTPYLTPTETCGGVKKIVVDISEQMTYAVLDYPCSGHREFVNASLSSTGTAEHPTVLGEFEVYLKYRYTDMAGPGYYLEDVPFTMYFFEGYGIHGTYWHSNFGTPMSHGCVNLPTDMAEWFFNWAEIGTPVIVQE